VSESKKITDFISVFLDRFRVSASGIAGCELAYGKLSAERLDASEIAALDSGRYVAVTVPATAPVPGLSVLFIQLPQGALIPERIINPGASVPPGEFSDIHKGAVSELVEQAWSASAESASGLLGKPFKTGTPAASLNTIGGHLRSLPALTGISRYFSASVSASMDGAEFFTRLIFPEQFIDALFADGASAPATGRAAAKPVAATPAAKKKIQAFEPPAANVPAKTDASRIVKKKTPAASQKAKAPANKAERNLELLLDIPVTLTVELGRARVTGGKLLDITPGSVVGLDSSNRRPVKIFVNEKNVAMGEIVAVGEKLGVRIVQLVDPKKRLEEF